MYNFRQNKAISNLFLLKKYFYSIPSISRMCALFRWKMSTTIHDYWVQTGMSSTFYVNTRIIFIFYQWFQAWIVSIKVVLRPILCSFIFIYQLFFWINPQKTMYFSFMILKQTNLAWNSDGNFKTNPLIQPKQYNIHRKKIGAKWI